MRGLGVLLFMLLAACSSDDQPTPGHFTDSGSGGGGASGGSKGNGGSPTGGIAGIDGAPGDAADAAIVVPDTAKSCGKSTCFAWPLTGTDAHEWVINNYVDLDPASGSVLDYQGGEKTYDGHNGIDIDVPNFRAMDADFPVIAAAPGKVTAIRASEFDRNTSCASNDANYVFIQHADGSEAWYLHLKKDSVVVAVGDAVTTGQKLGVVGSSGCSTQAHLHFEVHDATGAVVEPFQSGQFIDPPVYDTPLGFMDAVLKDGDIGGIPELKDPPPNVTSLPLGHALGVGLSIGGGKVGDSITARYVKPDGSSTTSALTFSEIYRHSFWYFGPAVLSTAGAWKIEISTNTTLAKSYSLTVN